MQGGRGAGAGPLAQCEAWARLGTEFGLAELRGVIAALNHPNICTIFDVGTDPPFLAMELLEGETLQQRLTRGAMDAASFIDIALGIGGLCDGALSGDHGQLQGGEFSGCGAVFKCGFHVRPVFSSGVSYFR